jgi:linear primary-alkylsulfatase
MKLRTTLIITLASVLGAGIASAQQQGTPHKPASKATKAANRAMQQYLNFNDKEDFENAARGFIGKSDTLTIKNAQGRPVWDLES